MFSMQGKLLLVFLTCFVWSLVECEAPCVSVRNGDSYTYSYTTDNTTTTSRDFFLTDIYGNNTTILICNATFPNCTFQNNPSGRFTLITGADHVSLSFTVWTALSKITAHVVGSYTYTNVTCFSVTAKPSSFSCSSPVFNASYVRIDCQATKGYLPNSLSSCSLYKQDSVQILKVTNSTSNPSGVAEWYNYTCSFYPTILDAGVNKLAASFNNSIEQMSSTVPEFTYTELNINNTWTNTNANLGNSVLLTCETKFIPAQQLRIRRKGLKLQLNETSDSRVLLYTIANFSCKDVDEYECTISNTTDRKSSTVSLSITCPPQILSSSQQNKVFTAKPGGGVLISTEMFTPNTTSLTYALFFEANGQIFVARPSLYSINCNAYARYYCSLNIALLGLTDSDFRNYFLSIKYGNLEEFANFTLSIDSSDTTKDALIGVAVVAALLFIAVLILVVVVIFLRRRRLNAQKVHQPVHRTADYDGVNQAENYVHDYGDKQVNLPKETNAKKHADEDEKYEPFTHLDQQVGHATATKPPSAPGPKKPKSEPPKIRPKLAPPEETYEMPSGPNDQFYGNVERDSQQIYGNVRESS